MSRPLPLGFWLALVVLGPAAARAQASPFVPLDHWSMPYVEHLIRAGVIADPDPMTRPLRAGAIVAALARADTAHASPGVRATIRQLTDRLTPRGDPPQFRAQLYAGGAAATQARRDPLRDTGPGVRTYVLGAHLTAAFGPVALSEHVYFDRRLWFDPDYTGKKDSVQAPGFVTDAYLSLQGKYGEFFFGAMQRNWGPTGVDGTLVSPEPYAYDHVMGRLGTPNLRVEGLVTQLDDRVLPSGAIERRHWATQRTFLRPVRWATLVVTQGTLWRGVGRGLEFRWLNPLRVSAVTRLNESIADSVNIIFGGGLQLELPRGAVLQADLMLDDLQRLPIPFLGTSIAIGTSGAPSRLAETLVLDAPLSPAVTLRGLYTMVTNLTYRTPAGPDETIALRGVGLGRNFADYAQYTLSASLMPHPMAILAPEVTLLKQGEGDFRKPFPPFPFTGVPMLYAGVVERTIRTALTGRLQLGRHLDLDANAALHFVRNRNHVAGASATRFVGGIEATYRLEQLVKLP